MEAVFLTFLAELVDAAFLTGLLVAVFLPFLPAEDFLRVALVTLRAVTDFLVAAFFGILRDTDFFPDDKQSGGTTNSDGSNGGGAGL